MDESRMNQQPNQQPDQQAITAITGRQNRTAQLWSDDGYLLPLQPLAQPHETRQSWRGTHRGFGFDDVNVVPPPVVVQGDAIANSEAGVGAEGGLQHSLGVADVQEVLRVRLQLDQLALGQASR